MAQGPFFVFIAVLVGIVIGLVWLGAVMVGGRAKAQGPEYPREDWERRQDKYLIPDGRDGDSIL